MHAESAAVDNAYRTMIPCPCRVFFLSLTLRGKPEDVGVVYASGSKTPRL